MKEETSIHVINKLIASYGNIKRFCLDKADQASTMEIANTLESTASQCEITVERLRNLITLLTCNNSSLNNFPESEETFR